MMKLMLSLIILVALMSQARAATFKSVVEFGPAWGYVFTAKSSALSLPTEVNVGPVHRCMHYQTETARKNAATFCFETEAEARIEAQKEADKWEAELIERGDSSSMVEARRVKKKVLGD